MSEMKASAAVALIMTECDPPSVLLLKRAKNINDPWSGQWAFPGGRWKETDEDLIDTGIRETYEECGCLLSRDELFMTLPFVSAGNHLAYPVVVAPFLWKLKEKKELLLDMTEIEAARWQKIETLKNTSLHGHDLVIPDHPEHRFSYLMLDGTPLWGFTYRVLMDYLNEHDVSCIKLNH